MSKLELEKEKAKILLGWTPTVELEEWIKTA